MQSGHLIGVAYSAEQRVDMSRFRNDPIREQALPQGLRQRSASPSKEEEEKKKGKEKRKKTGEERGTDRSAIAKGMRESVTRRSDPIRKGTLTEDPSCHVGRAHPHLRHINAAYATSVSQDFTKIDQPEYISNLSAQKHVPLMRVLHPDRQTRLSLCASSFSARPTSLPAPQELDRQDPMSTLVSIH
ncbi:hypothetical protein K438DRAFT_1786543 [Mycena galopus ATCC 62051]|nr:hypothetical protein K438DRAFT_1786543 [Mycena galopus ATCC 62051]